MPTLEIGTLADWTGVLPSVFATVISFSALKISREASKEVAQVEQQRQQRELEFQKLQNQWHTDTSQREEELRKRKAVAGVSAWWDCKKTCFPIPG